MVVSINELVHAYFMEVISGHILEISILLLKLTLQIPQKYCNKSFKFCIKSNTIAVVQISWQVRLM